MPIEAAASTHNLGESQDWTRLKEFNAIQCYSICSQCQMHMLLNLLFNVQLPFVKDRITSSSRILLRHANKMPISLHVFFNVYYLVFNHQLPFALRFNYLLFESISPSRQRDANLCAHAIQAFQNSLFPVNLHSRGRGGRGVT